jgi:hypothetical protein
MRQVLIGLMIILMLRFRPEGILRERPGLDEPGRPARPLTRPFRARTLAAARAAASSSGSPLDIDPAALSALPVHEGTADEGGTG